MQQRTGTLFQLIAGWRCGAPGRFPLTVHAPELLCRHLQTAVDDVASQPDLPLADRGPRRIVSLSSYVSAGLDAALEQAGGSSRAVRKRGQELTDRLKQLSRSKGRGGNLDLPPADGSSLLQAPRRKAAGWKATAKQIRRSGIMEAEEGFEESLEEEWGAAAAASDPGKAGRVRYGAAQAVGYAAARLPACHAVASHVFRELAARAPGFAPAAMLDFGAGPGTAVWAAADVWGPALQTAHAVEPSAAMRWLGSQIEAQLRQERVAATGIAADQDITPEAAVSAMTAPSIRWLQHLQGFSARRTPSGKGGRPRPGWMQSTGGRHYDLVVASYSLGELQAADRRQALQALWRATDGMLVLIEPGTPAGSALVRAARAQVLQWEAAAEGPAGCHVLAPCPHDGACPMDGGRGWCHFSQRFARGATQRAAKARPGHAPAGHQDERFAYVILRRGARPAGGQPLPPELAGLRQLLAEQRRRPAAVDTEASAAAEAEAIEALVQESLAAGGSDSEEDSLEADDSLEWDGPEPAPEQQAEEPTATHAAAGAGTGWARIIRPPRKRAGHIIVDVCAATGSGEQTEEGALLRQTVGTQRCKQRLGLVGYRRLKRLRWGGLWPAPATAATAANNE